MVKQILKQRPKNMRELKPYIKMVENINKLEEQYEQLTDQELKEKTTQFKQRLASGETIHALTVEAFATVRETSKRVLGLRHFDVQLLGGLVLVKGNISEMKTGEGKTLVASLPTYLYALEGKGVHIITVNEYLARRDKELIGQIHEFLGLTVGLNIPDLSNGEKKAAYNCDITYGVGTEFGFDYLRDNMVYTLDEKVQRPYHFAIIDEVDSVLIDEAKTPLIIAGKDQPSGRLYKVCATVVKTFKRDKDYIFDPEMKVVNFTEEGINKSESIFGIDNLFDLEHSTLFHSLLQALRALVLFERDVDYIVEDGEIKLIDMNTGRVMEGRSLSDGLHQAIESKEGLKNTEENKTQASITIQNYFRMYPTLSGMTGTAKTEEEEFREIYGMDVIVIPPNKPNQRIDHPDVIFQTKDEKYNYLIKEVKQRHDKGQPILIGTSSILQSEEVAKVLDNENIPYQLLNAKSAEKEAQMIALAGQRGKITIATNMAGRGTDILLGEGVDELGGLHVISTERNESKRIDNQLKGRSGRQGDPGSTECVLSLQDYLFTRYAADELERIKPKLKTSQNGMIVSKNVHNFVDTAQKICEGIHYQIREYNLKLEAVINKQREVSYEFREAVLKADNLLPFIAKQTETVPFEIIDSFCGEGIIEELDLSKLEEKLKNILVFPVSFDKDEKETVEDIKASIRPVIKQHNKKLLSYKDNNRVVDTIKAYTMTSVDKHWKTHLDTMHQFKQGVNIRQYQQEDPVQLFEKEGYALFERSFNQMKYEIAYRMTQFIKKINKNNNLKAK